MIAVARPESVFHPRRPHALALSVMLHGVLVVAWIFAPTPPLHDLGAGSLPIQLIMEPPLPEPPAPAPAPVEAPPQVQPIPQPTPKPVVAKPVAPKPPTKMEATPAKAATPAATEHTAPAEANAPPVQAGTGQAETAEAAPSAAAPPIGAANARNAARDEYMGVVWARIMRYRPSRVPTTGTTRLRFTLAADGELVSVEIAESSGSGLLDRAALDAVRRAAPFPPPPQSSSPVQLFEIPFQFRPNA